MLETAVYVCVCVCVQKSVGQGEAERERVHPSVCDVKLALSSAQYFGTLV